MKPRLLPFLITTTLALAFTAGCSSADASDADADAVSSESDFSVGGGTACLFGAGIVTGEIEAKYLSLGGCVSFLGPPVHGNRLAPDGKGTFAAFLNGSIYYRPDLGAKVVRGEIRELWKAYGWEGGPLGYPITDELLTPDGRGRYSVFEGGSVYWTFRTGAHAVRGAIRDKWRDLGWEGGALGYPIAEEEPVPGGIRARFERGWITWTRETGDVDVKLGP